jgi:hypothetical protein
MCLFSTRILIRECLLSQKKTKGNKLQKPTKRLIFVLKRCMYMMLLHRKENIFSPTNALESNYTMLCTGLFYRDESEEQKKVKECV